MLDTLRAIFPPSGKEWGERRHFDWVMWQQVAEARVLARRQRCAAETTFLDCFDRGLRSSRRDDHEIRSPHIYLRAVMPLTFEQGQRVMWLANVRSVPYRERIEATARAGFGCISTSPRDYEKTRATGLSDADIRLIAADNGVKLSYLDPFATWVPEAISPDEEPGIVPYLDTSPDEMFRIAEALQVDRLHLVGAYKPGRYSTAELTEHFARICDRAANHGLKCLLEGIAMWGLSRLDEAWAIIRDAGRPNIGIIFDTWHYTRVGRTDSLFAEIPPGTFDTIQIADGTMTCPPGRSIAQDCLFHRLPIGEGEIPNLEILRLLNRHGHISSVGPEIFSALNDELGTGEGITRRIAPGFEAILQDI